MRGWGPPGSEAISQISVVFWTVQEVYGPEIDIWSAACILGEVSRLIHMAAFGMVILCVRLILRHFPCGFFFAISQLHISKPLFRAENEFQQLEMIFAVCGSVPRDKWPLRVEMVRVEDNVAQSGTRRH